VGTRDDLILMQLDVTDREARAVADAAIQRFGPVHVL
jgi:hypothetical protein